MKDYYSSLGDADFFPAERTADYPLQGLYNKHLKRLFDIAFAILLLPVLLPVIGLIWIMAKRDGGAGFFGHNRIGLGNKKFTCWKIRSMVVGAEEKLQAYLADNPAAAREWDRDRKLKNDPRITRFGRMIRKTSLDELPQIWNVLRGDMSFVGPRPIVQDELLMYGADRWAYLSSKPGITGMWQVSGRNDTTYDERILMDVEYKSKASFLFDALVIMKTARAVITRTGK